MKRLLEIVIIFSFILSSCKKEIRIGDLSGIIYNEFNQPIEGATIEVLSFKSNSNNQGKYSFTNLPVGNLVVSASKEFFLTKIQKINITENKVTVLDFTLSSGIPYLYISDSIKAVNSATGYLTIKVTSNSDWVTSSSSEDVYCTTTQGAGDAEVFIQWVSNQESINKSDTIKFKSGDIIKTFILKRAGSLKLLKYEGIIGNGIKQIGDSVYVSFNKVIQVISIKYNSEDCKYNLVDNGYGVKFTFSYASLGGNYQFTISVSDRDGNTLTNKINVPFYKSRLHIAGFIKKYFLYNNDKELIIAAYWPDRIIRYSLEHDSIIQTYDLTGLISPSNIAYNQYNSKVYICGAAPGAETRFLSPNLPFYYTLDLTNGEIIRSDTIQSNYGIYENVPCLFGFTKEGYGIVVLSGEYSSHWEIMDCTHYDSIYIYPNGNSDLNAENDFLEFYQNHNFTKLWILQSYGICTYLIFDGSTGLISPILSPILTRSSSLTPNRINENVFVAQMFAQFIMNINGEILSTVSYSENYLNGFDFSYKQNEESYIYTLSRDYIEINDYSNAKTLSRCSILYDCAGLTSTLDGNYLITFKEESDISSSIYIFDTKYLYRHLK